MISGSIFTLGAFRTFPSWLRSAREADCWLQLGYAANNHKQSMCHTWLHLRWQPRITQAPPPQDGGSLYGTWIHQHTQTAKSGVRGPGWACYYTEEADFYDNSRAGLFSRQFRRLSPGNCTDKMRWACDIGRMLQQFSFDLDHISFQGRKRGRSRRHHRIQSFQINCADFYF